MAVISGDDYYSLSSLLGDAYSTQTTAIGYVDSGLREVVLLDDEDQEYDLLYDFYNLRDQITAVLSSPANYASAVRALNNHVINRSGMDLNVWLSTNGVKVTQEYATLSGLIGFTIDPGNIE